MIRTAAIIQARMTSSRLPAKVLAQLGGLPVLGWVTRAAKAASRIDQVIIATTTNVDDEPIVEFGLSRGVAIFRGSEDDVLDRFHGAAAGLEPSVTHIVRLTADCPFLDPTLIDACVDLCESENVDYACLGHESGFARGLDAEVFRREVLSTVWRDAIASHDRAHVTSFIYTHPEQFRITMLRATSPTEGRWTVDTPEDLAFARAVANHLPADRPPRWEEVKAVLDRYPEIEQINSHIRQKAIDEG